MGEISFRIDRISYLPRTLSLCPQTQAKPSFTHTNFCLEIPSQYPSRFSCAAVVAPNPAAREDSSADSSLPSPLSRDGLVLDSGHVRSEATRLCHHIRPILELFLNVTCFQLAKSYGPTRYSSSRPSCLQILMLVCIFALYWRTSLLCPKPCYRP